jgi:fused signal recognition particle receptor
MSIQSTNKIESSVKRTRESWFNKIAGVFKRSKIDAETWDELEELLILADVGVNTTSSLIQKVRQRAQQEKVEDGDSVKAILKQEMVNLLSIGHDSKNMLSPSDNMKVILVIGVNGSGKTTSIAKIANLIKKGDNQLLLAAADTFRAAAIDQLKHWAGKADVPVIAHQPGADPGAVVFDAIQAATNRNIKMVIADTAGRLHTKFNLMEELKKIKRVVDKSQAEQRILLVIDATTGQNGLIQAKQFSEATGIDGILLSKLDGTAKGGIVLAISDQLKIPILYIGTGEQLDDIALFDAGAFVEAIFAA